MERLTRQRKAILECLTTTNRPLSVEDIMNEVVKVVPSINLSTLYRNLKSLVLQRQVELHEIAGHAPRYLIAKAEHVHHFLCQSCNRLFMIHVCPQDIASMVPAGFAMQGHSITLTGLCKECLNREDPKSGPQQEGESPTPSPEAVVGVKSHLVATDPDQ